MRKASCFLTFVLLIAMSFPALSEPVELGWADLVPPQDFEDPFAKLTDDQLYDLSTILRTREFLLADSDLLDDELVQRADKLEQNLTEQGIDVDGLLNRREEIAEKRIAWSMSVKDDLNGQSIRMPGYVLPLEFEGQKVTEFFLVPYIGACMHAPTPPPNQMVHVVSPEGVLTEGLYYPVWVEGEMSTKGHTSDAFITDGTLEISAGYSMEADRIEPYE